MPYPQQMPAQGMQRDKITQALMEVQNPPPQTPLPQMPMAPPQGMPPPQGAPPPGPVQGPQAPMPNMPGMPGGGAPPPGPGGNGMPIGNPMPGGGMPPPQPTMPMAPPQAPPGQQRPY